MNFVPFLKKNLFTKHLRMAAPADSFIPTKVLSIDHLVHCSFIFLLSLIIGILGVFSEKVEKMNIFFNFIQ